MPGETQQAIKEQRAARVTAESKKNQSKNTKNTQTQAKTDGNSREQKETIMVLFSSFVTTQ